MSVTMQQVRRHLDVDETDYASAARLGEDALPLLAELIHGTDRVLAAKAVYLVGVIGGPASEGIVRATASSSDPILRVAAGAALRNL